MSHFAKIKGRNHSNLLCRKSQVKMCQGKNGQKWICLLHCIGGVIAIQSSYLVTLISGCLKIEKL